MSDSVMEKFQLRPENSKVTRIDGTDYADDFNCFGWLRGVRDRALMLECRLTNGNIISIAYSWLELAVLDLSDGITLTFGGRRVRILGRNLDAEVRPTARLYTGIVRHRVPWIAECSRADLLELSKEATAIEKIIVDN